jgi:hypothetical protein
MKMLVLGMLALTLGGCVTDQDVAYLASNYYSRADVDAIAAEMQCRQLARDLVQVARCNVAWRR